MNDRSNRDLYRISTNVADLIAIRPLPRPIDAKIPPPPRRNREGEGVGGVDVYEIVQVASVEW